MPPTRANSSALMVATCKDGGFGNWILKRKKKIDERARARTRVRPAPSMYPCGTLALRSEERPGGFRRSGAGMAWNKRAALFHLLSPFMSPLINFLPSFLHSFHSKLAGLPASRGMFHLLALITDIRGQNTEFLSFLCPPNKLVQL